MPIHTCTSRNLYNYLITILVYTGKSHYCIDYFLTSLMGEYLDLLQGVSEVLLLVVGLWSVETAAEHSDSPEEILIFVAFGLLEQILTSSISGSR